MLKVTKEVKLDMKRKIIHIKVHMDISYLYKLISDKWQEENLKETTNEICPIQMVYGNDFAKVDIINGWQLSKKAMKLYNAKINYRYKKKQRADEKSIEVKTVRA